MMPPSRQSAASLSRDEEQIDAPAAPLLRHRRAHAEPVRRPERPEALAELRGPVVEVAAPPPTGCGRPARSTSNASAGARLGVDALLQALRHLQQTLARVADVPDHDDPAITLVMRRLRSSASSAGGSRASTPAAARIG